MAKKTEDTLRDAEMMYNGESEDDPVRLARARVRKELRDLTVYMLSKDNISLSDVPESFIVKTLILDIIEGDGPSRARAISKLIQLKGIGAIRSADTPQVSDAVQGILDSLRAS